MSIKKNVIIKPIQNTVSSKTVIKQQANPQVIKNNYANRNLPNNLPSLIKPFSDIYNNKKSDTVFIIGGGPSLLGFDFSLLKGFDTIAINKAIQFVTDANYFITMDYTFLDKLKRNITEISNSSTETVFIVNTSESVTKKNNEYVDTRHNIVYRSLNQFNHTIESKTALAQTGFGTTFDNFAHGHNSGFCALQFALLLGYEKIYLLGFDLNAHDIVTHFHSEYRASSATKKHIPKYLEHFNSAFKLTKDLDKIFSCSNSSTLNSSLKKVNPVDVLQSLKNDVQEMPAVKNDLTDLLVVGYYTLNTPYEQEAEKLKASCERFKIEYDVVGVPNFGNWQANTRFKAKFMLDMLSKHPTKRLLYVDCDAIFHSVPKLFINYSADVAVRFQDFAYRKNECLSGTIYMENNLKTRKLCELWASKNKAEGPQAKTFEQWNLGAVIEEMAKTDNLVCKNLPPEYTFIFDTMKRIYPNAVPVIEHYQASRRFRGKV